MLITRKDFIKSSSILLGGLFVGGSRFNSLFQTQDMGKGFKGISDNIGIYTEKGGTILWYISNRRNSHS